MKKEEILHLATLARLELTEEEINTFPNQMANILSFVQEVNKVDTKGVDIRDFTLVNVMREDTDPFESGENRDAILEAMPDTQDEYLKVQKIL